MAELFMELVAVVIITLGILVVINHILEGFND